MKWSLLIARIAGIKIFIHWTFLVLLIWIILTQMQQGDTIEEIAIEALFILAIFSCVVLHELGHALMAKRYNIATKDITLLPIGGLARLDKIPEEPKQELWVALAGPAVNLLISGLIGIYLVLTEGRLLPEITSLSQISISTFMANLFLINLVLAVFNLIPAFPMDGGRVLRALLALKFSHVQATRVAAALGQIIAIGFAFLGLFYSPVLLLIAIFVFLGAQFEMGHVENKSILQEYKVGDVMMRKYHALQAHDTLGEAVRLLLDSQEKDFIVLSEGQVVGLLSSPEIIKGLKHQKELHPVSGLMIKSFRELKITESLSDVFEEFQVKKISILPVVQDQRLVGVLNLENVMEFIMVQQARVTNTEQHAPWLSNGSLKEYKTT